MKYVTKPKSELYDDWWDDLGPMLRDLTVDETEEYQATGLLDKNGNELFRQRDKIGF